MGRDQRVVEEKRGDLLGLTRHTHKSHIRNRTRENHVSTEMFIYDVLKWVKLFSAQKGMIFYSVCI